MYYCFESRSYICQKKQSKHFLVSNVDISKIKGVLVLKGIFSKCVIPVYACDLRTKFKVSSIILIPPPPQRTPKTPTQIRVKRSLH